MNSWYGRVWLMEAAMTGDSGSHHSQSTGRIRAPVEGEHEREWDAGRSGVCPQCANAWTVH